MELPVEDNLVTALITQPMHAVGALRIKRRGRGSIEKMGEDGRRRAGNRFERLGPGAQLPDIGDGGGPGLLGLTVSALDLAGQLIRQTSKAA